MLAHSSIIDETDIDLQSTPDAGLSSWGDRAPLEEGWKACIENLEKSLVERAMIAANGNKSKAAELLKMHRRLLYEKVREYGLQAD